jgi:hypothetical protein
MGFYHKLKTRLVAQMVYNTVPGKKVLEYSLSLSAIRNRNMRFQVFGLYDRKTDIEVEKMPLLN